MTTIHEENPLPGIREAVVNHPHRHFTGGADDVWVWTVDLAGRFLQCSDNTLDVVGYRAEELIGGPATQVVDTSELERCQKSLTAADGVPGAWSGLVVEGRHRNGSKLWFEIAGRPMHDDEGEVVGFEGSSRALVVDTRRVLADQMVRRHIEQILDLELLTTVFQPLVELPGGRVIGVEALTRFTTGPSRPPDRWFADAAAVGLGPELELLAIRRALDAATALPGHLHVSVNASPEVCLDPRLSELIRSSSVGLRRIILELTEHTPVTDYRALDESLRDLRKQGLRIAVDDAGAGFSSLQHILQLKPALIKLDRQVIANLDIDRGRQALGAAMVSFADHIGASVIAEGIETSGELRMAQQLGMTAVQGYLLGRPTADRSQWNHWDTAMDLTALAPLTNCESQPADTEFFPARTPGQELRRRTERDSSFLYVAADVFDALPDPTVVLDRSGFITATNQAWRSFSAENGGQPELSGVGVNYLDVCRRAADAGDPDAKEVLEGLTSVLEGELTESDREYPCEIAGSWHRYLSRITSLGAASGAIAAHLRIPGGQAGVA